MHADCWVNSCTPSIVDGEQLQACFCPRARAAPGWCCACLRQACCALAHTCACLLSLTPADIPWGLAFK